MINLKTIILGKSFIERLRFNYSIHATICTSQMTGISENHTHPPPHIPLDFINIIT